MLIIHFGTILNVGSRFQPHLGIVGMCLSAVGMNNIMSKRKNCKSVCLERSFLVIHETSPNIYTVYIINIQYISQIPIYNQTMVTFLKRDRVCVVLEYQ